MNTATPIPEFETLRDQKRTSEVAPGNLEWIEPETKERPRLASEALYGLAGDYVRVIEPWTEADPAGLLGVFLVMFGCSVGHEPHFWTGNSKQHTNEYLKLIGPTSRGRKETAQNEVEYLFGLAGPDFLPRIASGLASGEGLIYQVRDAVMTTDEDGADTVEDPGVTDKRLLVREAEFAKVLKVVERPGNTLSPIVRQAWDGRLLENLTKNSPHRATSPHICLIGHITPDEDRRLQTEGETANGFGNRFIHLYVERAKLLPDGERVPHATLVSIANRLQEALAFGRTVGEMRRTEAARRVWRRLYGPLTEGANGIRGALTDRAAQHVIRLSMIYALTDQQDEIDVPHLKAAAAAWKYAEDTVAHVFADSFGDSVADDIDSELRNHPEGLTRTDLMNHFKGHVFGKRLDTALAALERSGAARHARIPGKGRPAERWFSLQYCGESGQSGQSGEESA